MVLAFLFLYWAYSSYFSPWYRKKLVSTPVGATALTLTPWGASYKAITFVNIYNPAFDTEYDTAPC